MIVIRFYWGREYTTLRHRAYGYVIQVAPRRPARTRDALPMARAPRLYDIIQTLVREFEFKHFYSFLGPYINSCGTSTPRGACTISTPAIRDAVADGSPPWPLRGAFRAAARNC